MAKTAEEKAVKAAQKAEISQLKSAQKAEVKALKASGASRADIKAEKGANRDELGSLKTAFRSGTYTPTTNLAGIRSEASTYGNSPYAANVAGLLDSAAQNYGNYNIQTLTQSGNTSVGVGLDKLVDYQLGNTGEGFNRLMDRARSYVGNTYTLADLAAQGVKLKEDKQNAGLYKWSTGGDITYFNQNPDGTFTGSGISRVRTEKDGGILDSTLGKVALGLGAFYLGPMAGQLMGLSGGLGGAVGGGLLGGAASGLTGSNWRAGLLSGALGGFTGGGGFGDLTNLAIGPTQPAAPVYEAGTGQLVSPGYASIEAGDLALDATRMAQQGLSNTAIQQNLIMSGVDPALAASAADQAVSGVTQQALAADMVGFGASGQTLYPGVTTGALTGISTVGGGLLSGLKSLFPTGTNLLGNLGGRGISPLDLMRLMQPQQQQQQGGSFAGANADYNALIAALAAPRALPSLV